MNPDTEPTPPCLPTPSDHALKARTLAELKAEIRAGSRRKRLAAEDAAKLEDGSRP